MRTVRVGRGGEGRWRERGECGLNGNGRKAVHVYRKTWVDNQDFHATMKQEEACVDEMNEFLFMFLSVLS